MPDGLRFDRALHRVRLDMPATATGQHCVYDDGGGGSCTSLGEAQVHIDLQWTRDGAVTRDKAAVNMSRRSRCRR